jgi:Tfp pilus assembly protein PilO
MNKLPKEKRDRLILVILMTAAVLTGVWFGLIKFQREKLRVLANETAAAQQKLRSMETGIKQANQIESNLAAAQTTLAERELQMATGDLHSWMFNTIRQFKLPHKVEIPQFSSIVEADTTLLPSFPYRQVTMTISGTAYYHDFGRFVADFENQFPYMRFENLDISPTSGLVSSDMEKLSFKIDVVALIKPNAS